MSPRSRHVIKDAIHKSIFDMNIRSSWGWPENLRPDTSDAEIEENVERRLNPLAKKYRDSIAAIAELDALVEESLQ